MNFHQYSPRDILHFASEELKKIAISPEKFTLSSILTTPPWGGVAKNTFYNAVCRLEILSDISPQEMLKKTQQIEEKFGRKRLLHWGDRTLDIDIIFFGNEKIDTNTLIIPHRYWKERDFVIKPLLEVLQEIDRKTISFLSNFSV